MCPHGCGVSFDDGAAQASNHQVAVADPKWWDVRTWLCPDCRRVTVELRENPTKSTSSGEVVPVEPGEAEWTLDVLESLFDHVFVGPARTAARKAELNKKLGDAGKPLIT